MPFAFRIVEVEFSGGERASLPPVGVTLVVGPNNVGKSRCLAELGELVDPRRGQNPHLVVVSARFEKEGTPEDVVAWVRERSHISIQRNQQIVRCQGADFALSPGEELLAGITRMWTQNPVDVGLRGVFISHMNTERRLAAANPVPSFDAVSAAPTGALQVLYLDDELERRLCSLFRGVFGQDLVVNRGGGNHVVLHVGQAPNVRELGGAFSMAYVTAVREMSLLQAQGDGMRSFVGCLLDTDVLKRAIVLIDEPEAFLHPPQVRALARHIAVSAKEQGRQVFLSTHSSDVVRGVIDTGTDVAVVRLTRDGENNHAAVLNANDLSSLWKDPLLRASNLLDGLFHRQVVICEADGDCRFYSAVLEKLSDRDHQPMPDVLFTHTGGKHRLHVAIGALRAVNVPVKAIADLDILNDEQPLRKVWEALGHSWGEIERDANIVGSAVKSTSIAPQTLLVKQKLDAILEDAPERLDKSTIEKLRAPLKQDGGWDWVKKAGVAAVPSGDARAACDRLLLQLAAGGLHVVPVGTLEGHMGAIPGHGPGWLEKALAVEDLLAATPSAVALVESLGLR